MDILTPANSLPLILASASPRRKELLRQIGLQFEVRVSGVDEDGLRLPEDPVSHAVALALAKAQDVAAKTDNGVVIGADTVVAVDEHILGKPADTEDALRMLRLLVGRTHQVVTGVAVIRVTDGNADAVVTGHAKTDVRFRDVSDGELLAYIASGEPMDKAGAYAIQGRAALFIEAINGDYFNVVGLPLFTLASLLRRVGYPVDSVPPPRSTPSE
jgi:septum formation protein